MSRSSILAAARQFSGIIIGSSIQPGQEPGRFGGQNGAGRDVWSRNHYEGNRWTAADGRAGVDTCTTELFYSSFNPFYDDLEGAVTDGSSLQYGEELADDSLAPARGILFAIGLCAPVWAIVTLGVYFLLH